MGLERNDAAKPPAPGLSFDQFISGLAAAAKMKVEVKSPTLVVVPFDLGDNRKQNTFVKYLGASNLGHRIVGFFSPSLKLAPGQELNARAANALLRATGKLAHGAWSILSIEGSDYLGVLDTQMGETLQPAEFAAVGLAVASSADAFEKELGADVF